MCVCSVNSDASVGGDTYNGESHVQSHWTNDSGLLGVGLFPFVVAFGVLCFTRISFSVLVL